MSKLHASVLQACFIAALSTQIGEAAVTQPTPVPETTPAPEATATPSRKHGPEYFLAGDYMVGTNSKSEFNPLGINDANSWAARAAVEHPVGKRAVMGEFQYDTFQYTHQAGTVTTIGGAGQSFVPQFYARNIDWDGRVGVGLPYPRVFLVASYGQRGNNYGYPNLQGFGFGIEKLPDFDAKTVSAFGSYLWYPQFGGGTSLQYGFVKYQAGIEAHLHNSRVPVFAEIGYMGDYAYNKRNAPANISDNGFFVGIGAHF